MKKTFFVATGIVALLFTSCNEKQHSEQACQTLTFQKEKATEIAEMDLTPTADIALDTAQAAIVYPQARMRMSKAGDLYVFTHDQVFRYNADGTFLCTIGQIGHGNGEYEAVNDLAIDEKERAVEVLAPRKILRYDTEGKFIDSKPIPFSPCAFALADNGYWLANGRNGTDDDYAIRLTDKSLKEKGCWLKGSYDIPIMEDNFGRSPLPTFRESYSHLIYRLTPDSVELAYTIVCPEREIPADLYKGDPMEVFQKMHENDYILIKAFLESDDYIYMLMQEYNKGSETVNDYHWVVDKKAGEERIIALGALANGSYHDNPQCLTADGTVYFLGFPIVAEDNADYALGNAHIVALSLPDIFR